MLTDLATLGLSVDATGMDAGIKAAEAKLKGLQKTATDVAAKIHTSLSGGGGGATAAASKQAEDLTKKNAEVRRRIMLNSAIMTGKEILAVEKDTAARSVAIEKDRLRQIAAARAQQERLGTATMAAQRNTLRSSGVPARNETLFSAPAQRAFTAISAGDTAGIHEATKEVVALNEAMSKNVAHNGTLRGAFRRTTSALASLSFEVLGAIGGLTALGGVLAAPAVFGLKLLNTMETTKLGLTAILVSMGEINGEAIKLPVALELAAGMTQRLQQNAMKYGVDMIALADTTKAVLASGLGGGLALKEVEEIALLGSIAVKTIGLDAKQSVQEIRDLVAGGIQAGSSTLAVALGIGNKEVKAWREAGTLFINLKKAMVGFQDTAILKQDTLNGAWTIFVQKVQLLLANSDGFDRIKKMLIEISNSMGKFNEGTGKFEFNPQLINNVKEYWAAVKAVGATLFEIGKILVAITPYVVEFAKGWLMLKGYTLARGLVSSVAEVGSNLLVAAANLLSFRGELSKLNATTSPVIRVGVTLAAWEAGQTIGEWLNNKFTTEIGEAMEPINKLFYHFGESWGASIADGISAGIKNLAMVTLPKSLRGILDAVGLQAGLIADKMRAPAAAPTSSLLDKWGRNGATDPWSKADAADFVTGKAGAGAAGAGAGASKGSKPTKLDEIDPFYAQRTAAMKEQADEIKRFINEQQDAINGLNSEMAQEGVAAADAYASALASLLSDTDLAKTQDLYSKVDILNKAFFDGVIGIQQYDQAMRKLTEGTKEAGKEMDSFAKTAAENIQNSMAEFLFNPFENGLKGMAQSFGTMLQKMIAEAVAADLARRLFGSLTPGGSGSGLFGDLLTGLGNMLGLANGGAFGPGGVRAFASGGILGPQGGMLTRPTLFPMANGGLGIGGEAGVEAVMPLKRGSDGKLGVASGGGGHTTINVTVQGGQSAPDVRRAAGQGAREALRLMDGARRYG